MPIGNVITKKTDKEINNEVAHKLIHWVPRLQCK